MLLWAGFLLGCAFGVAARLGRFCLLRGLREAPALRAFALALAVALMASQALAWAGWADLGTAQVVRARFSLPGVLIGGLLFGAGMALAQGPGHAASSWTGWGATALVSALMLLPALAGMAWGERLRQSLSPQVFKRVLMLGLLALGLYMCARS